MQTPQTISPDRIRSTKSAPPSLLDLMRSPPAKTPVLSTIVAVNVLVFLAMLAAGSGLWHTTSGVPLAWGANFGPATQDGQWWRLLTAMFVHFGLWHVAMNMWALWDVGRLVERLLGPWRMALLYVGSGILGNLVSLVVQGNHAVSGGASGAVFSLYGALMVFLWWERRQVEHAEFRWLFIATGLFTVLILSVGWFIPGIDNAAHAGGLVAGALLGWLLLAPWTPQSPTARARWVPLAILVAAVALLINRLPEPAYRFSEEVKAQSAISDFLAADRRINQQWEGLLSAGKTGAASFEQLAGGADAQVADGYERSFERLLQATPQTDAPSAQWLVELQQYAHQRAEAARVLAEGLRERDAMKVRQAMQQAKAAVGAVRAHSPQKKSSAP